MSRSNVQFLDIPNEILLIILKKLDNIDVLYSFFGINDERLDILAQEKIFTNTLSFVSTLTDDSYSIPDTILNRFCLDILPRIHHNVKCLILESSYMKRFLLATDYPYLTKLKFFNFNQDIASTYFTDQSPLKHIFKQQITNLSLIYNEDITKPSWKSYTTDNYVHILTFFKNLTHLSIVGSTMDQYQALVLDDLPTTTFSSSILTSLCIKLNKFEDFLCLLDGRLKQLTTLSVVINGIYNDSMIVHNMDDLANLKCFSLTCNCVENYDSKIVPLLRRMSHLEELTLNISIENRTRFVDGTHLHNEILIHMTQLRTFIFYISTEVEITDANHRLSYGDIQQNFNKLGYQHVACIINNGIAEDICHVFSLPFSFDRLEWIGNTFPPIIFNYVTFLMVCDSVAFKHEFFIRVAQSFPILKDFHVINNKSPIWNWDKMEYDDNQSNSIVEFPHLTSLDLTSVDSDYVDQFLNQTKTYLPCLTTLRANYNQLATVTENFTRDATRLSCAKVKWLIHQEPIVHSRDFYLYFPLL